MIDEEDLRSRNGKSVGCWKQSGLQPWCWTGITGCSVCLGRVAISSWPPFVFGYESRLDARGHFSSWNNPGRIYSPYSAFCWTLCTGYCVFLKKKKDIVSGFCSDSILVRIFTGYIGGSPVPFHGFRFVGASVRWRHSRTGKPKLAMAAETGVAMYVRTVRPACMVHVCAGSLAT